MAAETRPDVILMDIQIPVMDGIAATTEILKRADTRGGSLPRIIVLTTFDLDEAATRAIRGGASGFVLKDADPEFLLASIRTVHAGSAVIGAVLVGLVLPAIPLGLLAIVASGAAVLTRAASVVPSRRATRITPVTALAVE